MAWQAVAAAAGQATAGILGNVLNNRYARKQLERQNAFNKEMWAMDNEYNSPAKQMARLREAGLNPNLVYGNGSVANTTKGPVRSDSFLNVQSPTGDLGRVVSDSLSTYQDVRMREAQIDNVNAQTENINARTITEGANVFLKDVLGKKGSRELEYMNETMPYQADAVKEGARQAAVKTDQMLTELKTMKSHEIAAQLDVSYKKAGLTIQQIQREQAEADLLSSHFKNDLAKVGLTPNDPVYMRVFIRMMHEAGITDRNAVRNAVKGLLRGSSDAIIDSYLKIR